MSGSLSDQLQVVECIRSRCVWKLICSDVGLNRCEDQRKGAEARNYSNPAHIHKAITAEIHVGKDLPNFFNQNVWDTESLGQRQKPSMVFYCTDHLSSHNNDGLVEGSSFQGTSFQGVRYLMRDFCESDLYTFIPRIQGLAAMEMVRLSIAIIALWELFL